jgi:hypothetical protein
VESNVSDEWVSYIAVGSMIVFAFGIVTLNAFRRRKEVPPPLASNDRKLYRLWRSDPDAYQRQYGQLDEQYRQAQNEKKRANSN